MNKRYTREQWMTLIKEFETSGKTRKDWCKKRNINVKTFGNWFSKFAKNSKSKYKETLIEDVIEDNNKKSSNPLKSDLKSDVKSLTNGKKFNNDAYESKNDWIQVNVSEDILINSSSREQKHYSSDVENNINKPIQNNEYYLRSNLSINESKKLHENSHRNYSKFNDSDNVPPKEDFIKIKIGKIEIDVNKYFDKKLLYDVVTVLEGLC